MVFFKTWKHSSFNCIFFAMMLNWGKDIWPTKYHCSYNLGCFSPIRLVINFGSDFKSCWKIKINWQKKCELTHGYNYHFLGPSKEKCTGEFSPSPLSIVYLLHFPELRTQHPPTTKTYISKIYFHISHTT